MNIVITHPDGSQTPLFSKGNMSVVTKAEQTVSLLSDDIVSISVQSATPLQFVLGDTIEVYGKTYTLNQLPTIKKAGERRFNYELTFEGLQYELLDAQFLLPDNTVGDSFTGNLRAFLQILIDNASRVFPGKWTLGEYPNETEYKTLTFDSENCLSVLQRLCEEYQQEFEIVQTNNGMRVLHIRTAGVNFPYTFKYGRSGGLYELTRQNINSKNVVTRLFVYGGSNNIPNSYLTNRNSNKLCLPGRNKNSSYIQDAEAVAAFGLKENTKTFDDIFPNRYGEVTAKGGKYYAFVDTTMSFDLNEKDADGNTKWLIAGVAAKVHFNTGNLAGYEFDVHKYDHATKTIELVPFTDENGMKFPSETSVAFQFAPSDKYFFIDINLPDAYITEAEQKLQVEAQAYYTQNSQPQVQYGLTIDENFIKQFAGNLTVVNLFAVGDYIPIQDTDIGVDKSVRITGFTRDLLKPYKYAITLGDAVTKSTYTRLISDQIEIGKIIEINNLANPAKSRRNWRASQEVLSMVFDPEGDYYSDKIKPLSIETTMLQVGAKSMQFVLQNVIFEPNYQSNPNYLRVSGGNLIHYTIEDAIRNWTIASTEFSELVSNTAYYIYARCQKAESAGSIILDTVQRKVDYEPGYYTFMIGVLNSVQTDDNGERPARIVSLTYGSSAINGRFIKTGRIESGGGGNTYFDLDNGEIGGKINFKDGLVSGDIGIGNEKGINAGMSGAGNADTDIRLWAGATKENMAAAPFRILQDGSLVASKATVEGIIKAITGSIGGFEIASGRIGVSNIESYYGLGIYNDFIKFSTNGGIWAGIGANVLSASSGSVALGRFENTKQNTYGENYGIFITVKNGAKNHALTLRGDIQGFAVATKQITSSYTVTEDDCVISCYSASGITVSLPTPSSVQIGKVYIIKAINATVTVAGSLFASEELSTRNITKGYATIFVNDGQFWILISYT